MNGDVTDVEVRQAVVTDRTVASFNGHPFRPQTIVHRAYIHRGIYYRYSTLFAGEGLSGNYEPEQADLADWPAPPAWFEEAAERLRLEVEELRRIEEAS